MNHEAKNARGRKHELFLLLALVMIHEFEDVTDPALGINTRSTLTTCENL